MSQSVLIERQADVPPSNVNQVVYIVFIGTPYNAPPSDSNREQFVVHCISIYRLFKLGFEKPIGYLLPEELNTVRFGNNFFARAGFVFENYPTNFNSIDTFDDDMDSVFPYRKVYDKLEVQIDHHTKKAKCASRWIRQTYGKSAM